MFFSSPWSSRFDPFFTLWKFTMQGTAWMHSGLVTGAPAFTTLFLPLMNQQRLENCDIRGQPTAVPSGTLSPHSQRWSTGNFPLHLTATHPELVISGGNREAMTVPILAPFWLLLIRTGRRRQRPGRRNHKGGQREGSELKGTQLEWP